MDDPATIDLHNSLYQGGTEILEPIVGEMIQSGRNGPPKDVPEERLADVRRACDMLEQAVALNPANWQALWVIGMGWKAAGRWDDAYTAFRRAFSIEPDRVDVPRELAHACLQTRRLGEAVEISRYAVNLAPSDPGLVANYAYALFANGDDTAAENEVKRALALDPTDTITQRLWSAIQEYRARDRS